MRIRGFRLFVAVTLPLSGLACDSLTGINEMFDHRLVGIAVDQGSIVEVGDTVRLTAAGDVDGVLGILMYDPVLDTRWSVSDPTVAQLQPLPLPPPEDSFPRARTLVRGLRPGLTSVTATARGVSGQASVRVIPVLHTIQLRTARDTVVVGDTISVTAAALDASGTTISELPVTFTVGGGLQLNGWKDSTARVIAIAAGPGTMGARFRRVFGETEIVVLPRGP